MTSEERNRKFRILNRYRHVPNHVLVQDIKALEPYADSKDVRREIRQLTQCLEYREPFSSKKLEEVA